MPVRLHILFLILFCIRTAFDQSQTQTLEQNWGCRAVWGVLWRVPSKSNCADDPSRLKFWEKNFGRFDIIRDEVLQPTSLQVLIFTDGACDFDEEIIASCGGVLYTGEDQHGQRSAYMVLGRNYLQISYIRVGSGI